MAQPAILRFQWELEVLLTNVRQFTDMEVVLLFAENEFTVPGHFRKKPGCSVFMYPNMHEHYLPAVRPYLLWKYLGEDPSRERETYFYIDSDIIFRQWPKFPGSSAGMVFGSDCSSYLDYKYLISRRNGEEIVRHMAEICGVHPEALKGVPGIGAHLLLVNPSAEFWKRSYHDSNALYRYLEGVDSDIQKWTAEMWAQMFGWVREGKTLVASKELSFCTATDPIEKWDAVNIMHNAGVTVDKSHELFFKGQYTKYVPFGRGFSWVRRDRCSYRYVQALEKVIV